MDNGISKQARTEVLQALGQRYRAARKKEKARILDEFVAVAHCHRKHAIRLLRNGTDVSAGHSAVQGRRIYDEAVREALILLWEAADRIGGKRLKAVLPSLVETMERHGHLELDPLVRARVLGVSPATIDRRLAPIRNEASRRRKRRAAKKASAQIPIRTFADWEEPLPGYLEIDFVVHSGGSMAGNIIHSLVATDVCSGWTEAVPLLAREQSLVVEGLEVMGQRRPMSVLGIDSDNDSAFINDTLLSYCQPKQIEFTRSRAYQKNDPAWIEQKNGAVIRRLVGYQRYSGSIAGQILAQLYATMPWSVNYVQPSFKLLENHRVGAKVTKRYDPPATPCDRLLVHPAISTPVKAALRDQRRRLDPIERLHRIREAQAALAALSSSQPASGPGHESLEHVLAQLPVLWRAGEVRPTHVHRSTQARHWRTRQDPFEGVWTAVLLWLQKDPDATAKSLFERLQANYPGQFTDGQLRTLQRRISEWRAIMARKLVHACLEDQPIQALTAIGG